jgi:hypothetical protein
MLTHSVRGVAREAGANVGLQVGKTKPLFDLLMGLLTKNL